jgi:hypothetical protein
MYAFIYSSSSSLTYIVSMSSFTCLVLVLCLVTSPEHALQTPTRYYPEGMGNHYQECPFN